MVEDRYEVVWTKQSQQQMKRVFNHISKDSPGSAYKVVQEIAEAVQKATTNPEIYSVDKYKRDNDGSYRALEKHHYRVARRFQKI